MQGSGKVGEISAFHFEWLIERDRFKNLNKGERINSYNFMSCDTPSTQFEWYLSLYPMGLMDSSDGYMGLILHNNSDEVANVACSLSLMTNNLKKISTHNFNTIIITEYRIPNFAKEVVSTNSLSFEINNGVVNVVNSFIVVCTIRHKFDGDLIRNQNIYHLTNESIFEKKKYSDVKIVSADGVEFSLHKNILAAQSSVFETMFDTDMLEKKENLVKIDDFESSVLDAFFEYLYTGKMYKNQARDLFIIAEKYNVENLKELCEDAMSFDVNVDNAIDYFNFAEIYNANKLKNYLILFCAVNLKSLIEKPEYKSLPQELLIKIPACYLKLGDEK